MFDYIGYVHSTHIPYGYQKEIVYHVIGKRNGKYHIQRHSEYTGHKSSKWYTLKELKAKIRKFGWITKKGYKYLDMKKR